MSNHIYSGNLKKKAVNYNFLKKRLDLNKKLQNKDFSKWLFENHGYSIVKAAFRHRNAVYFAAVEGLHETESRYFKLKDTNDGFYFLDKQGVSLEQFM